MVSSQHTCSYCNKDAKLCCTACKDVPSNSFAITFQEGNSTWYCSAECQKADRPSHQKKCQILKERKKLYRAGDILQAMLYMYREKMYDKVLAKIERQDGKTVLHEGVYPESSQPTA